MPQTLHVSPIDSFIAKKGNMIQLNQLLLVIHEWSRKTRKCNWWSNFFQMIKVLDVETIFTVCLNPDFTFLWRQKLCWCHVTWYNMKRNYLCIIILLCVWLCFTIKILYCVFLITFITNWDAISGYLFNNYWKVPSFYVDNCHF